MVPEQENNIFGFNDIIGWMRKNNRSARLARALVHFFYEVSQNVKFPNFRFLRQGEHTTSPFVA